MTTVLHLTSPAYLRQHRTRALHYLAYHLQSLLSTIPPTHDIHISRPFLNPSGHLSLTITHSLPESPAAWASNYRLT